MHITKWVRQMMWVPKKRREKIKKQLIEEQRAKFRADLAKTSEKVFSDETLDKILSKRN